MPRRRSRPRHVVVSAPTAANRAIGYGKPPLHTRFKKGQSGNPSGRRAGSKNLSTAIADSAQASVTVSEGGRRRRVTKLEAMTTTLADKAVSGDPRATQLFMQKLEAAEGRSEQSASGTEAVIEQADELVVKTLFHRIQAMIKGVGDATDVSR